MTASEALRDRYAPKVARFTESELRRLEEFAARGIELEDDDD